MLFTYKLSKKIDMSGLLCKKHKTETLHSEGAKVPFPRNVE